jgi:pheromone a factor receptor
MGAELPVLSFICAAILTVILALKLRRSSVANLTLIGWLLACNLLHAINSIAWANSVAIQVPAWCDIGGYNATIAKELFRSFPQ